jgi:phage-related protein
VEKWKIEFHQSLDGTSSVLDWFKKQPPKVKSKFVHVFNLLEEKGILLGMPHVRLVQNKLFEIRIEQDTNIYRIFYFAHTGKKFILLHGFQKKTQKLPPQEINIAEVRMKDFLANTKS